MKKINLAISVLFIAAAAALFFSCNIPLALGERLNLDPPEVIIESPDFLENVPGNLEIRGTASDWQEVVTINITIEKTSQEGPAWSQEWSGNKSIWRARNASSAWEPKEGVWISGETKGMVRWAVNVDMTDAPNGEYLISVGAINNVSNEGAQAQRRVVIDHEAPVVTILSPEVKFDDYDSEDKFSYEDDIVPFFDSYTLKNAEFFNMLHNQRIRVQYEIRDEFSIASLAFQLADKDGNIFYNEEEIPVDNLNWSGRADIQADKINMSPDGVSRVKLYAQLISIAKDRAGNTRRGSCGWLVYWPEADKPWVVVNDYAVDKDSAQTNRVYDKFPAQDIQVMSFDDDGVKEVTWQIFDFDGNPAIGYETPLKEVNIPSKEDASPSTSFSFSFKSPEISGVYKIVFNCLDVNGLNGDKAEGWFSVIDTSAPNVDLVLPVSSNSLFGDAIGDFTFKGIASDGTMPKNLVVAWLPPKSPPDLETQFSYMNSASTAWNSLPAADGTANSQGVKFWRITLDQVDAVFDSQSKRYEIEFTKKLNLFTDLGIVAGATPVPLSTQTFIFRLEGGQLGAEKKVAKLFTFYGDMQEPELDISRIDIVRGSVGGVGGTTTSYTAESIRSGNKVNFLEVGDIVRVHGTWSDDSVANWTDKSKMGALKVTLNNTITMTETLGTAFTNGKAQWSAQYPIANATEALFGGLRIDVSLTDLGGKMREDYLSAIVDTSYPILMNISSTLNDGSYSSNNAPGGKVNIYLQFNKPVGYFTGANNNPGTPSLTLNASGTVTYIGYNTQAVDGNAARTRHTFEYTIPASGANVDKLTVGPIAAGSGRWKGLKTDNTEDTITAVTTIPNGMNLDGMKALRIDTTPPTINSVSSLGSLGTNGTTYYNAGKRLYLLVTFSEDISFTGTSAALNLSGITTRGTAPEASGQNGLLFTYTVGSSDNVAVLTAATSTTITLGSSTIRDLAGNPLATTGNVVPSGKNINDTYTLSATEEYTARTHVIDNIAPPAPTINGVSNGNTLPPPAVITLSNLESGASAEYCVSQTDLTQPNTQGQWFPFPASGNVSVPNIGTNYVFARQIDPAGNVSTNPSRVFFTLERQTPLLQSFGGSTSGTYITGNRIDVKLNLREAVTVTGTGTPSLTLNIRNGNTLTKDAAFQISSNNSNSLLFSYTVLDGDAINPSIGGYTGTFESLEIISINMTGVTLTAGSTNVTSQLTPLLGWPTEGRRLSVFTKINIDTLAPVFERASISGNTLTLNFNKEIDKGSGDITLVQTGTYIAPAVLSKSDYERYYGSLSSTQQSTFKDFYEKGTNGTNASGTWDTTEKYILTFGTDTQNNTLVDLLKAAGADKITVSAASGAVTKGANRTSLNISLTNSYALKVKGVEYTLTLPQGAARDMLNRQVPQATATVTNPGVNPPFIRVQKGKSNIVGVSRQIVESSTASNISWIQGANVSITEQTGTNWKKVDMFVVELPRGQDIGNNGISVTALSTYILGGRSDNAYPERGQLQGPLSRSNSNQNNFRIEEGWNVPNGYTKYHDSRTDGNFLQGGDFYVNPYIYPIVVTDSPDWSRAGNFVVRNLWVDTSTGTERVQNNSPGTGWLRMSNTVDTYRTIQEPRAEQPHNASVKIDCQTPGATLMYTSTPTTSAQLTSANYTNRPAAPSVTMPTASGTEYNATTGFTLGDPTFSGFLYGIRAQATYGGETVVAYEKAARSVIQFNGFNGNINNYNNLTTAARGNNRQLQLWLRGGDQNQGDSLTPGFPLTWDERDYSGIQLLTQRTGTDNWYWITWEVTARPAYLHFIAGTTGETEPLVDNVKLYGPFDWSWGKNSWAFLREQYLLRPGESLLFTRDTQVTGAPQGTYEFFEKFGGTRPVNP